MAEEGRKVTGEQLLPGMAVLGVTAFSSEYSYLDRATIQFLASRFQGATCTVRRKGTRQDVGADALEPLDELLRIGPIPQAAGLTSVDDETVQLLRQRGMKAFLVSGEGEAVSTEPTGPAAVPGKSAARRKRVTEARVFLERVGKGAEKRDEASNLVQDLFNQGRSGKYSTKPAQQAVDDIVKDGLSGAMVALAGLKGSDQTYAHCVDMSVIFQESYTDIIRAQGRPTGPQLVERSLLAGFCHDIGKSTVPKEILDSTKRFERDSKEMQMMRNHAAAGAKILSDLGMDADTINVAHYHHVKVNTDHPASYPEAKWEDVRSITRLAAVVDVYQALIGKRSYKKNWVPGKAVEYLRGLRGEEFDPQMIDSFLRVIGVYPVGSLVRLSTGDLAFVVAAGGDVAERPVVAVVENAGGELLRQHPLIDLMEQTDLSVAEVVDHYEHYSESEDQAFRIFSSLNVT